jgi:hypothetical protein
VNQVYYWRVDESSSAEVWTGKIWSFTTADHPIIDDMENYTDNHPERIGETWSDRYTYRIGQTVIRPGNGTGMTVGVDEAPFGPERDEDLVYSGLQSLPLTYDNRGVGSSLQGVYISETSRTFSPAQNWAMDSDGKALRFLQLMLRGRYVSPCTYNYDDVNDQYTVIGAGTDIFGDRDEFHFAYQSAPLSGTVWSISAKIESLEETSQWSKAGVMIRNGLEPDAQYAAVVSLPDGDIVFQYRTVSGEDANIVRPDDYDSSQFTLPYWVKIKYNGSEFTAQMSADGQQWVDVNEPVYMTIVDYAYAGLAVSAHEADGSSCEAVFSNVAIQGTNPTLDKSVDIGLLANDPANMYIRLKDATGATDTWDDPCGTDAVATNAYRAVNIPLSEFNIDLTRVAEMVIGIGDASQAGGEGKVYVDDIALFYTEPEEANRPPVGEPVDPGTDNLVAAYSFEGDVTDTSGNGNDGTMMGDPGFVQGMAGQALDLDGDGDYVDCGNTNDNFDITGEVSVAMWSKLTSNPISWAAAVAKGEGAWRIGTVDTSRRYHFAITNYGPPTVHAVDGNVTVRLNEWHHVVGVCDGSNIMIYVDGELDNSVATASPITVTNQHMLIGENPGATGRYWSGQLDEIKIYNKALSSEEVLYLSQAQ